MTLILGPNRFEVSVSRLGGDTQQAIVHVDLEL